MLLIPTTDGVPPMILEPLSDVTVIAPNDAVLECDLDLGEPEAEIKWWVKGAFFKMVEMYRLCFFQI